MFKFLIFGWGWIIFYIDFLDYVLLLRMFLNDKVSVLEVLINFWIIVEILWLLFLLIVIIVVDVWW